MRAWILAGLLASGLAGAENAIVIPSDAVIYIDAADGFDVFVNAAFEKKHVPLTVTTDKSRADYAIEETGKRSSDEAAIRLVNLRNGEVVLAWVVDGKFHSRQSAEAMAKRLALTVHPVGSHKASAFSKDPALDF